jgi:hypothetical protein
MPDKKIVLKLFATFFKKPHIFKASVS